jgi:hypothetical protein
MNTGSEQSIALMRQQLLEQEDRVSRERLLIAEMEVSNLEDQLPEARALLIQMEQRLEQMKTELAEAGGRENEPIEPLEDEVMDKVARDCPL